MMQDCDGIILKTFLRNMAKEATHKNMKKCVPFLKAK